MFLFPIVGFAQQPWYKYSPMDYTWKYVGNEGFSAGEAWWICLAFSPSGQPYIAFCGTDPSKATVMKFDGSNWENVGNAGFSAGETKYTSLAINPTDSQPYVAYMEVAESGSATVMKFNGTKWMNVGNAGFSSGQVGSTSLAFSPSGQPYVAYQDWGYSGKATVMKFDSVYYGINDIQLSKFSLYPNPAKGKCEVRSAKCNIKNIEIFNLTGEKVYGAEFPAGGGDHVEIRFDLLAGGYFVKVMDEKGMSVQKLVVE
jgi:hypothetical protein